MRFETKKYLGENYVIGCEEMSFREILAYIVKDNLFPGTFGYIYAYLNNEEYTLASYGASGKIFYCKNIKELVQKLNKNRVVDVRYDEDEKIGNVNWHIFLADEKH